MSERLKLIDTGVLFMLASSVLGALNGAVAKYLSASMDPLEIVFYRNLLGVLIILFTLKKFNGAFDKSKVHLLLLRGLFGALAMALFFYTIATIPLGEAVVLNRTSPFFVTILAYYLVKESISLKTFFALIIGFIGIILVMKPFDIDFSIEHILGVMGGFFAACAYATIKKIKDIYDARLIMLSFMGVGIFIPLILYFTTSIFEFKFHTNPIIWALIGFMAIISTGSQWFITRAYSVSKASIIGVVSYTNIPFSIGFGVALGDAFPDLITFIGIVFVMIGGILVGIKSTKKN